MISHSPQAVVEELKRGGVVICPAEHSYVLLCDAFNQSSVRRIHEIRGDLPGIAAQVVIGKVATLSGITQRNSKAVLDLAAAYWPGLLTLNLQPNPTLNWDLGDSGALGEIAVRIPNQEFLLEVLNQSGPLAMASASRAGFGPILEIDNESEIIKAADLVINSGTLTAGPLSTVVRASIIGKESPLEISRVGAITFEEIAAIVPEIKLATA